MQFGNVSGESIHYHDYMAVYRCMYATLKWSGKNWISVNELGMQQSLANRMKGSCYQSTQSGSKNIHLNFANETWWKAANSCLPIYQGSEHLFICKLLISSWSAFGCQFAFLGSAIRLQAIAKLYMCWPVSTLFVIVWADQNVPPTATLCWKKNPELGSHCIHVAKLVVT